MSAIPNIPRLRLPAAPRESGGDLAALDWRAVPGLPPLIRADGSRPAEQQTAVRVCADERALYVRLDCDDRDIWATYARRDDPVYEEEVVEVMISPGPAAPARYYEFEVSPDGVLLDALIENPGTGRADIVVRTEWDCAGLRWAARREDGAGRWWAALAIPWAALRPPGDFPATWRANFYRIERPRGAEPEYSCWSPTLTDPADFHRPERFGFLEMEEVRAGPWTLL